MKHKEIRELVLKRYSKITRGSCNRRSPDKMAHRYADYESCGRMVYIPEVRGKVKFRCNQPVCPACSFLHARKLSQRFSKSEGVENGKKLMFTFVRSIWSSAFEAIEDGKRGRKSCQNAIRNQRNKGSDRAKWEKVALAGYLEIDAFEAKDFYRLGVDKMKQYRDLGYDPATAVGTQWVTTFHGVMHIGNLDLDVVSRAIRAVAPVIHLQPTNSCQDEGDATDSVLAYGAKVNFVTSLALGSRTDWSEEALCEYIVATYELSRGRQSFRLFIGPQKNRKKKSTIPDTRVHVERDPMPILIG